MPVLSNRVCDTCWKVGKGRANFILSCVKDVQKL